MPQLPTVEVGIDIGIVMIVEAITKRLAPRMLQLAILSLEQG